MRIRYSLLHISLLQQFQADGKHTTAKENFPFNIMANQRGILPQAPLNSVYSKFSYLGLQTKTRFDRKQS